ncbi:MAG: hypothetical protein ACRD96_08835 [Bryobacteraceae bacterium]
MLLAALAAAPGLAQYHHNFRLGLGSGQPRANLRSLYRDSFGLALGYGFRFHPYMQLDAGLDSVFGAAGVRDFLPSQFGDLRIRDYQFLVPVGGRVILPFLSDRAQIHAGGGAAYMRYTERVRQPSDYFRIDCSVCASRHGWGYYGLVGASVGVDRRNHWRIGVSSRIYRGHTDGDPLGAVDAVRTRDHWVNIFGEMIFSF